MATVPSPTRLVDSTTERPPLVDAARFSRETLLDTVPLVSFVGTDVTIDETNVDSVVAAVTRAHQRCPDAPMHALMLLGNPGAGKTTMSTICSGTSATVSSNLGSGVTSGINASVALVQSLARTGAAGAEAGTSTSESGPAILIVLDAEGYSVASLHTAMTPTARVLSHMALLLADSLLVVVSEVDDRSLGAAGALERVTQLLGNPDIGGALPHINVVMRYNPRKPDLQPFERACTAADDSWASCVSKQCKDSTPDESIRTAVMLPIAAAEELEHHDRDTPFRCPALDDARMAPVLRQSIIHLQNALYNGAMSGGKLYDADMFRSVLRTCATSATDSVRNEINGIVSAGERAHLEKAARAALQRVHERALEADGAGTEEAHQTIIQSYTSFVMRSLPPARTPAHSDASAEAREGVLAELQRSIVDPELNILSARLRRSGRNFDAAVAACAARIATPIAQMRDWEARAAGSATGSRTDASLLHLQSVAIDMTADAAVTRLLEGAAVDAIHTARVARALGELVLNGIRVLAQPTESGEHVLKEAVTQAVAALFAAAEQSRVCVTDAVIAAAAQRAASIAEELTRPVSAQLEEIRERLGGTTVEDSDSLATLPARLEQLEADDFRRRISNLVDGADDAAQHPMRVRVAAVRKKLRDVAPHVHGHAGLLRSIAQVAAENTQQRTEMTRQSAEIARLQRSLDAASADVKALRADNAAVQASVRALQDADRTAAAVAASLRTDVTALQRGVADEAQERSAAVAEVSARVVAEARDRDAALRAKESAHNQKTLRCLLEAGTPSQVAAWKRQHLDDLRGADSFVPQCILTLAAAVSSACKLEADKRPPDAVFYYENQQAVFNNIAVLLPTALTEEAEAAEDVVVLSSEQWRRLGVLNCWCSASVRLGTSDVNVRLVDLFAFAVAKDATNLAAWADCMTMASGDGSTPITIPAYGDTPARTMTKRRIAEHIIKSSTGDTPEWVRTRAWRKLLGSMSNDEAVDVGGGLKTRWQLTRDSLCTWAVRWRTIAEGDDTRKELWTILRDTWPSGVTSVTIVREVLTLEGVRNKIDTWPSS